MKKYTKWILLMALALNLSACTRFGEFLEDKPLGVVDNQEIHKLAYGSGNSYKIYLYYPLSKNAPNAQVSNEEVVDTYGSAQVVKYTFPSGTFENDNEFFKPFDTQNSNQNLLGSVFTKDHPMNDDGQMGSLTFNGLTIDIHQMSRFVSSDLLFVGVVHKSNQENGSVNVKEQQVLGTYNNSTIYQFVFDSPKFLARDPVIYLAVNQQKDVMPLSSEMTYSSGKSSVVIRSNLILLDESGHLIEHNMLTQTTVLHAASTEPLKSVVPKKEPTDFFSNFPKTTEIPEHTLR